MIKNDVLEEKKKTKKNKQTFGRPKNNSIKIFWRKTLKKSKKKNEENTKTLEILDR